MNSDNARAEATVNAPQLQLHEIEQMIYQCVVDSTTGRTPTIGELTADLIRLGQKENTYTLADFCAMEWYEVIENAWWQISTHLVISGSFASCPIDQPVLPPTLPLDSDLITRAYIALTKELGPNFFLFQITILFSGLLCGILVLAAQLFARDMVQELEKKSPYECGFFPFDSATRLPFDVHFYVVGIMFLVFDVELVILTTIIVLAATMPWAALANVAVFIIVLTVGFIYEWSCDALRWDAKIPAPVTAPAANNCLGAILVIVVSGFLSDDSFNALALLVEFIAPAQFTIPLNPCTKCECMEIFAGLFGYRFVNGPPHDRRRTKPYDDGKDLDGNVVMPPEKSVSRRTRIGSRAAFVDSWRPRRWIAHEELWYQKREWSPWIPEYERWIMYNETPSFIATAPGRLFRKVRYILRTKLLPNLHYHTARLHRWPPVILICIFAVPAITIPWFWIVEDYDIVFNDLRRLYDDIQHFSRKIKWFNELPEWFKPVYITLTLYPAAIWRSYLRWHYEAEGFYDFDGPLMFVIGAFLAWDCWELAPGGSWSAKFYVHWYANRRRRLYHKEIVRRWRAIKAREEIHTVEVRPHPDAKYTDWLSLTRAEKAEEDRIVREAIETEKTRARNEGRAAAEKQFEEMLAAEKPPVENKDADDKSAEKLSLPIVFLAAAFTTEFFYPICFSIDPITPAAGFTLVPHGLTLGEYLNLQYQRLIRGYMYPTPRAAAHFYGHAFMDSAPYFSLFTIILGLQYGVTGVLLPILRYLMYPKQRRWHIPPIWSLWILYVSIQALIGYMAVKGNTIAWVANIIYHGYHAQLRKSYYVLYVVKFIVSLFILPWMFIAPLFVWRIYERFLLGRRTILRKLVQQGRYCSNLLTSWTIADVYSKYTVGHILMLKRARDESDRKRNRTKIRDDCAPFLLIIPVVLNTLPLELQFFMLNNTNLLISYTSQLTCFDSFILDTNITSLFFILSSNPDSHDYLLWQLASTQLFLNFLPEVVLSMSILAAMANIAVEKMRGVQPKLLAISAWRNLCKAFILVSALYIFQLLFMSIPTLPVFNGYLFIAPGLTFSKLFVLLSSLFVLHSSELYIRQHPRPLTEYPIIISLGVLLLLILVAANDIMAVFFSLAGFSLALYVLVLFDAEHSPSREAGVKYFYLSTLSAGIILMGAFLIYHSVGSTNYFLVDTFFFNNDLSKETRDVCSTAVVLILLGFFFKLSAFPGHLWAPEVYEGSPAPILAFFVLPVKIAVFLAFLRMINTAFHEISYIWMPIIFVAAVGSLIWGALSAVDSYKITRFLAYASINQIGFMLLGASLDTFGALRATYIYLFLYAVMTGGFMLAYLHLRRPDGNMLTHISDFSGLVRTEPSICWSLAVTLFSMAGIPPLAGFFSKFFVLNAILARGLLGPTVIALAISLISAYYYLRIIVTFWFGLREEKETAPHADLSFSRRVLMVVIEATLWVFCVAGAPLLPEFDTVVWPFWICG